MLVVYTLLWKKAETIGLIFKLYSIHLETPLCFTYGAKTSSSFERQSLRGSLLPCPLLWFLSPS